MRIVIEEDSLETIQVNNRGTRNSLDIINKQINTEIISNDIGVEFIDNTLIILNSPGNTKQKIRIFFKKKEADYIRKQLAL